MSNIPQNTGILKWYIPFVFCAALQYEFAKDGLDYTSPFVLMSIRYLSMGAILLLIGRELPLDSDSLKVAFLSSISTAFWALGLEYVSPGDSAVLSYTMPLFSIALAVFIANESLSLIEVIGAVVGFSGVIIYSITLEHGSLLIGAIFTLVNAVFWGAFSVYYRKLRARKPIPLLTTQFLVGSIPLVAGSLFFPAIRFTPGLAMDSLYLITLGGLIQLGFWNALLRRARVGKITTMAFAVPAVTVAINSIRTSSIPGLDAILGATIMFVGIFISSSPGKYGDKKNTTIETRVG